MDIEVDVSGPLRTVNNMLRRLGRLRRDIAHELSAWQTEDVHRERPFTRRKGKGIYQTKFRPHSLYEVNRGRVRLIKKSESPLGRQTRKRQRIRVRRKKTARVYRRSSTRPILRSAMIARLHTRMSELLHENLRWH